MERNILKEIARDYATPAYVFDLDELEKGLKILRERLGGRVQLCYAMKANPFLIQSVNTHAARFEVCSPGEFRICERAGIPLEKIVLSGVYKEKKDIVHAIAACGGKGIFTIESRKHLELLSECAREAGRQLMVLIRVTSGNQFGVEEEEVCRMTAERVNYPWLKLVGIQYYSGTQKKRMSKIEKELLQLDHLLETLKTEYGFEAEELEYGPGFYVPYFQNEESQDDGKLLAKFAALLENMKFQGRVILEMGRYIASECGCYLTKIVDKKNNHGENYCMVDGGIHHVNYYGQTMAMKIPPYVHLAGDPEGSVEEWNVCGALCTVGDVLVKHLPLQNVNVNDILVFERLGAYSITEGIYLFLSRDLPKVLFYSSQRGIQVVRKEQATDTINSIQ